MTMMPFAIACSGEVTNDTTVATTNDTRLFG